MLAAGDTPETILEGYAWLEPEIIAQLEEQMLRQWPDESIPTRLLLHLRVQYVKYVKYVKHRRGKIVMERLATINRTDLARRTRQMVDRVRRGDTLIVESYGEEQVVLMDVLDYRLMRAVATYHHSAPQPGPLSDPTLEPVGLSEAELIGTETQTRWNRIMAAYLDGHISLGRAATLLGLSRYELDERFRRLDIPRRIGPETIEEARAEVETALAGLDK